MIWSDSRITPHKPVSTSGLTQDCNLIYLEQGPPLFSPVQDPTFQLSATADFVIALHHGIIHCHEKACSSKIQKAKLWYHVKYTLVYFLQDIRFIIGFDSCKLLDIFSPWQKTHTHTSQLEIPVVKKCLNNFHMP